MKFMKFLLKKCLLNFIRFYCSVKSNSIFSPRVVKKVLIFAYTGLGNFVMYTPAIRAIREFIPQANFTLFHGNDTGCHEVISGSNLFDKYIIVRRNANWWTRIKWIYKVRKEKYNLIISEFHNNDLFMVLLTILSGSKYRLGYISSPGWKNDWDFVYNIPVKMKKNQHEVERYMELAYALGISDQDINKSPFIQIDSNDMEFAKKFLASRGVNNRHKIISVQFGTSPGMRWKQWDLDKYKELCNMILELPNTKIIMHGSPSEVDMINGVAIKMKNKPIIAAGKTSVKQAAVIIKESDLLICNDSGLMHIAVAVGTPVVAIYGPTDYTRTAPLGKSHTIIRKNLDCSPCFQLDGAERVENCPYGYKCLNYISVEEVFSVVTKRLMNN